MFVLSILLLTAIYDCSKYRSTILELIVSYNLTKRIYVVNYVVVFCLSLQSGLFEGNNHNPRACSSLQCSNETELGVYVMIFVERTIMLNACLLSEAYGGQYLTSGVHVLGYDNSICLKIVCI